MMFDRRNVVGDSANLYNDGRKSGNFYESKHVTPMIQYNVIHSDSVSPYTLCNQ